MSNGTGSEDRVVENVSAADISPVSQNIAVTHCTTQQEQWGQLSLCKLLCFKDFVFLRTHLILFTGRGWYLSEKGLCEAFCGCRGSCWPASH